MSKNADALLKWFENNYFKMNGDKCKLLVTKNEDNASLMIDGYTITGNKCVKLLGIKIDNNLNFNDHVSTIYKKVGLKLILRLRMKAFIESQFSYCPLIWMFHNSQLNNKINRLHERALRLVYNNSTLSFDELLMLDNSFTVHHINLQKLSIEMYKVKKNLSPNFMKTIFPLSSNN